MYPLWHRKEPSKTPKPAIAPERRRLHAPSRSASPSAWARVRSATLASGPRYWPAPSDLKRFLISGILSRGTAFARALAQGFVKFLGFVCSFTRGRLCRGSILFSGSISGTARVYIEVPLFHHATPIRVRWFQRTSGFQPPKPSMHRLCFLFRPSANPKP